MQCEKGPSALALGLAPFRLRCTWLLAAANSSRSLAKLALLLPPLLLAFGSPAKVDSSQVRVPRGDQPSNQSGAQWERARFGRHRVGFHPSIRLGSFRSASASGGCASVSLSFSLSFSLCERWLDQWDG